MKIPGQQEWNMRESAESRRKRNLANVRNAKKQLKAAQTRKEAQ